MANFRTETAEWWRAATFTAPSTATNPNPPGVGMLHRLPLPTDLVTRHIWLAAGAYIQKTVAAHWFTQGCLEFFLRGQRTGCLLFTDASSELTAAERAMATREIVRVRSDASGSTQPALRYQTDDKAGMGYKRDNLDIAAFSIRVEADEVLYQIDKSYYDLPAADELSWVFGLRVQSEA